MDILATIGTVAYGVLLVILGLNALIIVHELGHFIVARLCGVRCEKFYIWFDFWGLRIFRFKWGNTEYGLGLFPLGGYLKMLGQEDNPGAIQAEIERAKLQAEQSESPGKAYSPHPSPLPVGEGTLSSVFAPDSFLSKSIPQRLAIIVAGVVMNILFAVVCGAGAYMIGVQEMVPAIGDVMPGSPAWKAGLQTGDRITAIDGKPARAYADVLKKMIEGEKTVKLSIDRQGESMTIDVSSMKRPGDLFPRIGILPLPSLELIAGTVGTRWEPYYSAETLKTLKKLSETNPLVLEKVNGQAVNRFAEYQDAQLNKIGQPITCTFGGVDVEIPAIPMREIPVRFKMGPIAAVLTGSDAEKQGIVPGDTILSVDGDADFDPLKLPQILLRKVNANQETVELVIKKASGTEQTLTLELKPNRFLSDVSSPALGTREALGSAALGLAWSVEPIIAAVGEINATELQTQDAPKIGDKLVGVTFSNCERLLDKKSFSITSEKGLYIHSIGSKVDVPYIFTYLLQNAQPQKNKQGVEKVLSVKLHLESPDGTAKTVVVKPISESTDWFQLDRGFDLKVELMPFKAAGIGEALHKGMEKTIDYSLLVYKSVNSLINGSVSPRALNGPVGIVGMLYTIALSGRAEFLMLLCLLGANLAVINLLPIPPLDGGLVVFLAYEGIFGRPPNELVQVILSYLGLFLIILLMVWTLALDLSCIPLF